MQDENILQVLQYKGTHLIQLLPELHIVAMFITTGFAHGY
jgi:hypothetical protein